MMIIITVFNSQNAGSVLQATSLYKTIKKMGYDVAFLDVKARSLKKVTIRYCLKRLAMLKFSEMKKQIKLYHEFAAFLNDYHIVQFKDLDLKNDVFILGSDEIWNVRRKEMSSYPIFWGNGLPSKRYFSYAPTINTSTISEINQFSLASTSLNNSFCVSVRDRYSKEVLGSITDKNIEVVVDPTHLLESDEYSEYFMPSYGKEYILIYGKTNVFKDEDVNAIKVFARENNLKIVSYFFEFEWADEVVRGGPKGFVSYVNNARIIVGASFHIAAFSILFNKKFVMLDKSNTKVAELLAEYGLEYLQNEVLTISNLENIYRGKIEYEGINLKLNNNREKSLGYLSDNLKKIENQ